MPSALQSTTARTTAREDIARALQVLELEAEIPLGGIGMTPREIRRYSLLKMIGQLCHGDARGVEAVSGLEADAHRTLEKVYGPLKSTLAFYVPVEIQHRHLNVATASAGGYLVGASSGGSLVDVLRNRSVAFRLGAQPLPDQRENVVLPKITGSATVTWLQNETTAPSASQLTLGQVAASPKIASGYTQISGRLMAQSNPAGELVISRDLAATAAIAVDAAVIKGTGKYGEPLGILNTAGVGTFSGTTLGLDALTQAQADVLNANAMLNPATLGYATTPTVAKLLKGRQRFTGTDTPVWQGALHDGEIEGVRATSSLQIPEATLLFGDWSQIVVAEFGALAIEVNPFASFMANLIGIRVLYAVDVMIRHAASFTVATSIN